VTPPAGSNALPADGGGGGEWRVWARIGLQSFGGPAAQIAVMHRVLVEEQRWLDEPEFLRALGFCMLLPGPEAMQLATYAGWRRGGVRGGLAAGLWFVLPGAAVVTALAAIYVAFGHTTVAGALLLGIKAAVLVLVFEAVARLARRALKRPWHRWVALAAFAALFAFAVPFPIVVLVAGVIGAFASRAASDAPAPAAAPGAWRTSLRAALLWGAIWAVPLLALAALAGPRHVLAQLGAFFSKLAVVTFGGAYAVLTYMAQEVVVRHGWLSAGQMVDGLGLAETTPGPLILVTVFVGFLAAANAHPAHALTLGLAGAAVALWATFVPCFLWIFAGAPHIERIAAEPRLRGALEGITAAVLGVIANLGVWFSMHVLFAGVRTLHSGPWRATLPVPATLEWRPLVLAALCALLFLRLRWSVHRTLAVSALAAWGISLVGWR
jgi:chromate transporter